MGLRGPLPSRHDKPAPLAGLVLKRAPKPPAGLGDAGRTEWRRAVAELGPKGRNVLTEASLGVLEDLARMADDAVAFREVWIREGMTVQGQGRPMAHPMIGAERDARAGMSRLRRDLFLTLAAASRAPVGAQPEKPKDEFD